MKSQLPIDTLVPYFYCDTYISDTFEGIWHDLGDICSNYGFSKSALYCFSNALRHKRKEFRNYYRMAREMILLNFYEKLPELITNVSEADSSHFYEKVLMGHYLLSQNKIKESHSCFEIASKNCPKDFLVLLGVALWNERIKNHLVAFKYYSLLIQEFPSHVIANVAKFKMAMICKQENCFSYAKRFLLALLNEESCTLIDHDDLEVQLASCFELENEVESAIELCEGIKDKKPDHLFALRLLGWIYLKNKELKKLANLIDSALAYHPKDSYLLFLLGKMHCENKQYERSKPVFAKALDFSPNDPEILNSFGISCYKTGSFNKAEFCFSNAIKIDTTYNEAKFNLMLTLRINEKPRESKKCLEELMSKQVNNCEYMCIYKNFDDDEYFENLECKDVLYNLAYTPYFAPHLFLGGNMFFLKSEDMGGLELDPIGDE